MFAFRRHRILLGCVKSLDDHQTRDISHYISNYHDFQSLVNSANYSQAALFRHQHTFLGVPPAVGIDARKFFGTLLRF